LAYGLTKYTAALVPTLAYAFGMSRGSAICACLLPYGPLSTAPHLAREAAFCARLSRAPAAASLYVASPPRRRARRAEDGQRCLSIRLILQCPGSCAPCAAALLTRGAVRPCLPERADACARFTWGCAACSSRRRSGSPSFLDRRRAGVTESCFCINTTLEPRGRLPREDAQLIPRTATLCESQVTCRRLLSAWARCRLQVGAWVAPQV
jgi:hypothetical protein